MGIPAVFRGPFRDHPVRLPGGVIFVLALVSLAMKIFFLISLLGIFLAAEEKLDPFGMILEVAVIVCFIYVFMRK